MFHRGGPIDASFGAAHADFVVGYNFLDSPLVGDGGSVGVLVVVFFLRRFFSGGLLFGSGLGLVVIVPDMRDHIVEGVVAGKLEGAHELEDGLLLVLGLDHEIHVRWARRQRGYPGAVFPALPAGDSGGGGLRVVHFWGDVLALPRREDSRVQVHDVGCAFANLRCVEDDFVVVEVENKRDVELFAERKQGVDRPADVVVLKHKTVFDPLRESRIIRAETIEGRGFVVEHASKVENHDGVAIGLLRELQEGKQFCVHLEVADRVIDHLLAWRAELGKLWRLSVAFSCALDHIFGTYLSGVSSHPVP